MAIPKNNESVILVNEKDEWMGLADKIQAHKQGLLHRAFSVFIFNDNKEMLLQKRAAGKYHSGSLWTNACCSHPREGESTFYAAHRRMMEEMGFDCTIEKLFTYQYKLDVGDGLTEHEFDHIYTGTYNGVIKFNTAEVEEYKYVSIDELLEWIEREPEAFTMWFKTLLPVYLQHIAKLSTAA